MTHGSRSAGSLFLRARGRMRREIVHLVNRSVGPHRRSGVVQFAARSARLFLDAYENNNYVMATNGEERLLRALSPAELACVFDVGANEGEWAALVLEHLPKATVHCFELSPTALARLKARLGNHPRAVINEFGLADHPGKIDVKHYPADDGLTSYFEYPHPHAPRAVARAVDVTTADDYAREHNIERIDLLKVDVEGAEHLVLEGCRGLLASGSVDLVQFEYGRINVFTRFLLRDFYELLTRYGYRIGKIYPYGVEFRPYDVRHEDFLGPNYLAARDERDDLIALVSSDGGRGQLVLT